MNKISIVLFSALIISIQGISQTKSDSTGKVGKAINKAGNKTAEVAVKGVAGIKDKKYESKVGPQGQTIYINKDSRYYYVDGRGKKVFVSKSRLKNRP